MVDALDIPVVTVGGIADGRSLAAALTLGAQGVMMASRFMATRECDIHDDIKQELVRRQENDTTMICKTIGLQGRALKTGLVAEILDIEKRGGGLDEIIPLIGGERTKQAWETGDVDLAPMLVGQSIGLIHDVPSCQELLDKMAEEAVETLTRTNRLVTV